MTKGKSKVEKSSQQSPGEEGEQSENKRLKDRAVSQGLFGRAKSDVENILRPSKQLLRCDGRDIVKKTQRRSKFLFSFPGLLAPVSGGRLGELAQLDTKNPVLYIEFPLGRLKLFGTITYPTTHYLTLDLPRGQASVACEDCFDCLVIFSQAWWVGRREENPEERQLDMPPALAQSAVHSTFNFEGGAGRAVGEVPSAPQERLAERGATPDEVVEEVDLSQRRRSMRTGGKQFIFKEAESDESLNGSGSDSGSAGGEEPEAMDGGGREEEAGSGLGRGRGRKRGRGGHKKAGKEEGTNNVGEEKEEKGKRRKSERGCSSNREEG